MQINGVESAPQGKQARVTAAILTFLLTLLPGRASGQAASFRLGTDFPLRYTAGLTYNPYGRVSLQVNAGFLTTPYDDIILDYLSLLDVDEDALDVAERAFDQGGVYDIGANLNIGKGYVGVFGQFVRLRGSGTPIELLEAFLNLDLSPYYLPGTNRSVTLRSTLYQAGARLGTRIPVFEPDLELHLELSFSVNIDSESSFTTEASLPEFVYDRFEQDLREVYQDYLYLPSIGAFLVYNFGW